MTRSGFFRSLALSLALAPMLAAAVPAAAQSAKPVCDLVSEADAVAVLGSVKQKQTILGADQCVFTTQGMSLIVSRIVDQEPEQVKMLLDLPANRARPGDVVKDEPGIGQGAVSETSKGRINIIAASGSTVWTIAVDHVYSKDLSELLPKLRALAKKVVN